LNRLFEYNWQVRDEWFTLSRQLPQEELLKERVGGLGFILKTLFHVVDAEYSWIQALRGVTVADPDFEQYRTLESVLALSSDYRKDVKLFIDEWTPDQELIVVTIEWREGQVYTCGEVLRHVLAHEIHHMGQLSVWARDMGISPPSADFLGRGIG
jgi:uncharacterized damage-inducible protein DinB